MKHKKIVAMVLSMIFIFTVFSFAASISGLQVMMKVYKRPVGYDQQGNLTMTLINSSGDKRVRKIRQLWKDFGRVEKKIMMFLSPADVRKTTFMNWSYDAAGRSDDQWIYLPALRRVKRISSDSSSDYFMGSDFTYDDLGDRHPSKDRHKVLRMERFKGEQCYVVESKPKNKSYMYSKTITWIIKGKWIGLKRAFYDEDGALLKNLTVEKYRRIKGYWIILHSKMRNVQKNHTTDMFMSNLRVNSGVPAYKFSVRIMKRGL